MSAAFKVPQSLSGRHDSKRKKTISRTDHPAKLSNRGIRVLQREVNLMVTFMLSSRDPSVEMRETSRTTVNVAPHWSGLNGRKSLPRERHVKEPSRLRNKILSADETEIELFDLNSKCHVGRKPGTAHHLPNTSPKVNHGVCRIMLGGGCFLVIGTDRLVRVEGKLNGAECRDKIDENLVQCAQDLRPSRGFTFQHDNDPRHTPKTAQEWLEGQLCACPWVARERPGHVPDCPYPTWQSWRGSAERNDRKSPNPGSQSFSRRSQKNESVIALVLQPQLN